MNDPRVRSFQISPGDLEAAQLDDLIREIEQKSLFYHQEKKKLLRARYIYGTIFLIINLCAWFIRDYAQKALTLLPHVSSCGPEGSHCFHTLGVLRVSLGCFIFFLIMFLSTWNTMKLHQAQNTWHSDNWSFKFLLLVSVMVASFFIPQLYIQIYGEIARVGAGIFLGLQLISVIEFITWWNNYWMPNNQSKQSCSFGFVMSIVFYIGSVCGIAVMYYFYVASTACALNIFFISLTVILLIIMMVMSLHSKVKSSLMSSGIMASYIVFLCWSAIRSEPSHTKCNAHTQNGHTDWITVLSFLIAIGAIVMATFSTGIDSESFSFQFRKDEAKEEDDIPYSYGFFHLVFSLGAMYFAMLFISWNLEHSARKWSMDVGWTSTWVKIVNEWFAAGIYLWKLIAPIVRQPRVHEQPQPTTTESSEAKCHKNTVAFQNNLTLSKSVLKVHCKSRDDDLGDHFLRFQDAAYNFSFHDHFILYTRFKCILSKGANLEYHKTFLGYEADKYRRCGALYAWEARDDAIYLSTKDEPTKLMYSWDKD
ncbi:BnaA04g19250D [Brassica napus]|uniref:BnaA04g19250D protein n=1 Tax=Brassica napus TaxID=3708 RepID=A0A078HLL0_BRANA|nr:BnaA04g19250D [Brassica napus]